MNLKLKASTRNLSGRINITGSKSESNRLLELQAFYPNIILENVSNSDDSQLMQKALHSREEEIDIHHAGTAMRFLSSYFSIQEDRETLLTGSHRMKERPVKILVDALRELGASIAYDGVEGYPPLRIKGKAIEGDRVVLKANVSSQYISSLLLIAPKLKNGLTIVLDGEITSRPYLEMTLKLLTELGIENTFNENSIYVSPTKEVMPKTMVVESDWSSVSYFYSLAALSETADITLSSYKQDSLQGDRILAEIYPFFGVETQFSDNEIRLTKTTGNNTSKNLELDLTHAPDIAQTIVVSCLGNGLGCHLTGLHTLKIKETDRLEALKTEVSKLGGKIKVSDKELWLEPNHKIIEDVSIATYHDHRMAMAFAPLALRVPLCVEDAGVVSKSYPDFWKDLQIMGISSEKKL